MNIFYLKWAFPLKTFQIEDIHKYYSCPPLPVQILQFRVQNLKVLCDAKWVFSKREVALWDCAWLKELKELETMYNIYNYGNILWMSMSVTETFGIVWDTSQVQALGTKLIMLELCHPECWAMSTSNTSTSSSTSSSSAASEEWRSDLVWVMVHISNHPHKIAHARKKMNMGLPETSCPQRLMPPQGHQIPFQEHGLPEIAVNYLDEVGSLFLRSSGVLAASKPHLCQYSHEWTHSSYRLVAAT